MLARPWLPLQHRAPLRRLHGARRLLEGTAALPESVRRRTACGTHQRRGRQRNSGTGQPREEIVVSREVRMQQSPGQRGGAACGRQRVDHLDVPATACECLRAGCAGETGADHHAAALSVVGCGRLMSSHDVARREARNQPMPLAAVSAAQLDVESGRFQRLPDRTGAGVGREQRVRASAARDVPDQLRLPHLGVAVRCKAVEKDRIGADDDPWCELASVAEGERQHDPTRFEFAAMQPAQRQRPAPSEFARQFAQLGRCRFDQIRRN